MIYSTNIEQDEVNFRLIELGMELRETVEKIRSASSKFFLWALSWILFKVVQYLIKNLIKKKIEINPTNYPHFKKKQQILHEILQKHSQESLIFSTRHQKQDWFLTSLWHNQQTLLKWVKIYTENIDKKLEMPDNQVTTRINALIKTNQESFSIENYRFNRVAVGQLDLPQSAEDLIKQLRK